MNILFVIGSYDSFGGTEKITTVLANALIARANWVGIASFRGLCKPKKLGLCAGVSCYSLEQVDLRQVLVNNKVEVIINQWCLPFFVTCVINKARKGLNIRLISALHGVPDKSKKVIVASDAVLAAKGVLKFIAWLKLCAIHFVIKSSIRYVYHHSDAYVVLSNGFLETFRDYTGLRCTPKLFAIGNPITIPTDYETDWTVQKKKQILYVGRMDKENKRVNRIIEAWERVAANYKNWTLTLVGGGPHLVELEAYVADKQIPRVTFTGFLKEDPIKYYQDSSIFMLTSDLEGFGLVLVEAMSYGVVPIVYGSYVSVFDIIDNGKSGFITPVPYSQQATVEALCKLMDNQESLADMSKAASEKSKSFTLSSVLMQWKQVLGEGI